MTGYQYLLVFISYILFVKGCGMVAKLTHKNIIVEVISMTLIATLGTGVLFLVEMLSGFIKEVM